MDERFGLPATEETCVAERVKDVFDLLLVRKYVSEGSKAN